MYEQTHKEIYWNNKKELYDQICDLNSSLKMELIITPISDKKSLVTYWKKI